jgi:hypothetical protein
VSSDDIAWIVLAIELGIIGGALALVCAPLVAPLMKALVGAFEQMLVTIADATKRMLHATRRSPDGDREPRKSSTNE